MHNCFFHPISLILSGDVISSESRPMQSRAFASFVTIVQRKWLISKSSLSFSHTEVRHLQNTLSKWLFKPITPDSSCMKFTSKIFTWSEGNRSPYEAPLMLHSKFSSPICDLSIPACSPNYRGRIGENDLKWDAWLLSAHQAQPYIAFG